MDVVHHEPGTMCVSLIHIRLGTNKMRQICHCEDICPAGNSVVQMSHQEFWKSLLVPFTALNSCNYFSKSLMLPPVAGSSFIQILDTPKLKTWLLNHERGIFGGLLIDELGYCYHSTLRRSYSASPKTFQLIQKAWSLVLTPPSIYSCF